MNIEFQILNFEVGETVCRAREKGTKNNKIIRDQGLLQSFYFMNFILYNH